MSDLENDLRSDAAAWREQVDAARPAVAPGPARSRTRAYLAGIAAAAVVVAVAVVALVLRHPSDDTQGPIAAGGDHATTRPSSTAPRVTRPAARGPVPVPTRGHVPQAAKCPTSGSSSYGSGFAVSFAAGAKGAPTIEAAAAKFPPKNVQWAIARRSRTEALLLYRSRYLHVVRLPGGGWAVDSGGGCGGADATVAK